MYAPQGQGERILPCASFRNLHRRYRARWSSTKPVTTTVTHAGITVVDRFEMHAP
jgi:hypothetical protein